MANRAFKFKIFPTAEQKNLIDKTIGCSRFIYNQMLNDKIKYYELNKQMLYNTPAQYKSEFEFLKEVDSVALANAQLNLEKAFKGFFTQPSICFPKFKAKKRSKLRYTTNYNNGKSNLLVDQNKLKLPKVGLVDIDIYRNIPENYQFRSATIEHLPTDEYYVSILFEYEQTIPNINLDKSNSLGLDYSSPDFYSE